MRMSTGPSVSVTRWTSSAASATSAASCTNGWAPSSPRGRLDSLTRARAHGDGRPLPPQRLRDPEAEALGGSGDERDPAFDPEIHG